VGAFHPGGEKKKAVLALGIEGGKKKTFPNSRGPEKNPGWVKERMRSVAKGGEGVDSLERGGA